MRMSSQELMAAMGGPFDPETIAVRDAQVAGWFRHQRTVQAGPRSASSPGSGRYTRTAPRQVTPLVTAEARRLGVDITTVTATGVGGRVTVNDVHNAAPPPPAGVPARAIPTRRATAAAPSTAVEILERAASAARQPVRTVHGCVQAVSSGDQDWGRTAQRLLNSMAGQPAPR